MQRSRRTRRAKGVKREPKVTTELINCKFCDGTGKDPNSGIFETLKCAVCKGTGKVRV
jgi:DnaJ-class molecular chaperone